MESTEIEEFVEYHRKVIEQAHELNKIFKPIVFVELVVSATLLCFLGLGVIKSSKFENILAAFLHCTAGLTDASVYAYGGQKLIDKSTDFSKQLYPINTKYLPIIIVGQKGVKFDGGLFDATLESLQKMISYSISFVTLLESFMK